MSASMLTTSMAQKDLKQTQERLQVIIDHIDTITNVNNFRQITSQNQSEIIQKLQELLTTLENLQPTSAVINMPGYEDLNETRRKLQIVIGVLLNSLSQLTPSPVPSSAITEIPDTEMPSLDKASLSSRMQAEMSRPKLRTKFSFSELVTELDDSHAFGTHHLLQDRTVWKKQILDIPDMEPEVTPTNAPRFPSSGDNGGHKGKTSKTVEQPCGPMAEMEETDPTQSQKQQIQHLLLQLQVRTCTQADSGATTTDPAEGTTQTNSWQVTTHPSQLVAAVQNLLEQGFSKIAAPPGETGTPSGQRKCTLVITSSACGGTTTTTTTTHVLPQCSALSNSATSLSMTVTPVDGPPAVSLRSRMDASSQQAKQPASSSHLWGGNSKGISSLGTLPQVGLGAGCGDSQRLPPSGASPYGRSGSPVVTAESGQKFYGKNQGGESLVSTAPPHPSFLMTWFYKLEVTFYAVAFFLIMTPFAIMVYWGSTLSMR